MIIDNRLLGEAARWSARLAAPDCSEKERAEHARWLLRSTLHRAAFEQVSLAAAKVSRALELDRRLQLLAEQAFATRAVAVTPLARRSSSQHRWALAAAAGFVCVLMAVWRFTGTDAPHAGSQAEHAIVLEAPAHKTLHASLADGTLVHIDAGSKVEATLSEGEREVKLLSGRAYFEVAHDASRPFAVTANGTRTVALGTKFAVECDTNGAIVTLTEGSVAVNGVRDTKWRTRLHPGEQLAVNVATAQTSLRRVDPNEVTGWSRGWLEFRATPLADALRDINRYSVKQVVVADDALLRLSVAGRFVAGDTQSIVDAIAAVLPIRVVDGGSHEIILFKRYEN